MLNIKTSLLLLTIALTGCATGPADDSPYNGYADDYDNYGEEETSSEVNISNEVTLKEASEQVVIDIRGKKNALSYMNYQKPVVQCGVMLPGRIIGSSVVPPSEGCIVHAPGAFIDSSNITLPLEGGK